MIVSLQCSLTQSLLMTTLLTAFVLCSLGFRLTNNVVVIYAPATTLCFSAIASLRAKLLLDYHLMQTFFFPKFHVFTLLSAVLFIIFSWHGLYAQSCRVSSAIFLTLSSRLPPWKLTVFLSLMAVTVLKPTVSQIQIRHECHFLKY